jgi:hypothetical protein
MLAQQTLWSDFGAVEELSEQAAETISGGAESFTIYNDTNKPIPFILDGNLFGLKPGQEGLFTTTGDGIITFDDDLSPGFQGKSYNLADGSINVFEPDQGTSNPYDIDLYKVKVA